MNWLTGGLMLLQALPSLIQAIVGVEQAFATFGAAKTPPAASTITPPSPLPPKLGPVKHALVMAAFADAKPALAAAASNYIHSSVAELNGAGVFTHA
jgi:hypothetical protein